MLWWQNGACHVGGFRSVFQNEAILEVRREMYAAVLFGAVFVMTVRAPDCKKDLDVYETFIETVTKISWEGRRVGAKWSGECCRRFGNVQRTLYRTHFFSCTVCQVECCQVVIHHSLSMHLHGSR